MNQTNFLNRISSGGQLNIEINTLNRVYDSIEDTDIFNDNIYFLGGVKGGLKGRAKDDDIEKVNYIRFDIDLIKNLKAEGVEVKSEDLGVYIDYLKFKLDELEYFNEYSFIICSGGGVHIYYLGNILEIDENFTANDFGLAMDRIYRQFDKVIGEKYLMCDHSVRNIGRIMRLPGTVNQKYNTICKILYEQDINSRFLELLPKFARAEKQQSKQQLNRQEEDAMIVKQMNKLIHGKDKSEDIDRIFEIINMIPAWRVSEKLLPEFKLNKNGKNFDSGRKGKGNAFKGFWYSKDLNGIVNGGSECYNWGDINSCWSPAVLVRNFYNYDWKSTINWFKKEFNLKI